MRGEKLISILGILFISYSPLTKFIINVLVLLFLVFETKNNTLKKTNLIILILLVIYFLLTSRIINEEINDYRSIIVVIVDLIIIFLYCNKYSYSQFKNNFLRIMYPITIISLLFFGVTIIIGSNPAIYQKFGFIKGSSNINIVIYNFVSWQQKVVLMRNSGFAWEPGAFQFLLNLSFFYEIQRYYKLDRRKIVYIIAIITTFSSTGYLILAFNIFVYIFFNRKKIQNSKIVYKFILIISLIVVIAVYLILTKNSFIFKKLSLFNNNNSANMRLDDFIRDMKIFYDNILIGIGILKFNYLGILEKRISTNSHTLILASFGIIGYLIYNILLYTRLKQKERNYNLIFILIMLAFTNEVIWLKPFLLLFIFLKKGAKKNVINRHRSRRTSWSLSTEFNTNR